MKSLIFLIAFLFYCQQARCCFILFNKDENNILVGNHEDWFTNDAAIKISPPRTDTYGSITFTFLSEGWAQGGMNEKGLFFDAAQTPYQDIIFDPDKKKPESYPWQEILDRASNVKEALDLLNDYSLPQLEEATIMLADATGDAVIIGVHNHKLDIRPLAGRYMIQTNFNRWHPELSDEPVCKRYQKAEELIASGTGADIRGMLSILKETHQDSMTVYSNIYDLKNKAIYVYNKRNFGNAIIAKMPDLFQYGNCLLSLDSLASNIASFGDCQPNLKELTVSGKIVDENDRPVPYANIGVPGRNTGTLSDPDGSFEITLPLVSENDSLIFSSVGFEAVRLPVKTLSMSPLHVRINSKAIVLDEIIVSERKLSRKIARLGWMGGKDGILPLDTIMGGGAVALLVQSPQVPFYIEKLQVRLMYNSKDTLALRFHVYEFDSVKRQPGKDLLTQEIMLVENKRFGWLRFDLSDANILVNQKRVCIGFEWIDKRKDRLRMLAGLRNWEIWKRDQFVLKNKSVEFISPDNSGAGGYYKYHGNMMDWPGFQALPPFTALMVDTGKKPESEQFVTFERKTSFGNWSEVQSTLNAVITISY